MHATQTAPRMPAVSRRVLTSYVLIAVALLAGLGWLAITKTAGRDSLAVTAALRKDQATALTDTLSRTGSSGAGQEAQVILATPDFFRLTGRAAEGRSLGADSGLLFVVNETVHFGDLPHHFGVVIRVDGRIYAPTAETTLVVAVHHRTSALVFGDVSPATLTGEHQIEMLLPPAESGDRQTLSWRTPIGYPGTTQGTGPLSLGLLLTMAAALLATISPCLLQLTAFYLPTLAGVSVDPANVVGGVVDRRKIMPVALLFVLGFTIPYTLGGALMGAIGGALAASGIISPTGPIAVAAGLVMIGMAVLVARRARAPLVCRLPMPALVNRSKRLPGVEAFTSGFAIATGCLMCFGGAILGVLVVYTGLLGSPLLGGLAMFLFSIGIAIPFLLAAFFLTRVRPLLDFASRATPTVGLVAALVMLFFGLTMATGNFHTVSGWLYQHLPLA